MFYMLKYNCVFDEMPLINVEGKRKFTLPVTRCLFQDLPTKG